MSVMMRQIMALFDEYQSKENEKAAERPRSSSPAGRSLAWRGACLAAETRGARAKRKLAINLIEAETVRLMFTLAVHRDGQSGPMGMRQLAQHLNDRGIRTGTGGRWGLGAVHQILTRTTYVGRHRFNVKSWRRKEKKPQDEVVEMTPQSSSTKSCSIRCRML